MKRLFTAGSLVVLAFAGQAAPPGDVLCGFVEMEYRYDRSSGLWKSNPTRDRNRVFGRIVVDAATRLEEYDGPDLHGEPRVEVRFTQPRYRTYQERYEISPRRCPSQNPHGGWVCATRSELDYVPAHRGYRQLREDCHGDGRFCPDGPRRYDWFNLAAHRFVGRLPNGELVAFTKEDKDYVYEDYSF